MTDSKTNSTPELPHTNDSGKASGQTHQILICASLILMSLVLRFCLINFQSLDYQIHLSRWYDFLVQHGRWSGLGQMDEDVSNYPPLYLYLLSLASLLPLPKIYAIKLLSIAGDYAAAWYLWRIGRKLWPVGNRPVMLVAAFLFLPTVVTNSACWAQCDILYTTGFVASLYYFLDRRPGAATIAFGIACSLKPQAIFWCPLLAVLFINGRILWKHLLIPIAVYVIAGVPAILAGRPATHVLGHWMRVENLPGLVHNAPNWYQWVGAEPSGVLWKIGVSLTVLSSGLFVFFSRRDSRLIQAEDRWLISLALLSVLFPPFLLPGMHERYFFAADVLSLIFAFAVRWGWYPFVLIQTASFFSYFPFLFRSEPIDIGMLAILNLIAMAFVIIKLLFQENKNCTAAIEE
jgi:Gpi18-like mannosyltransferase